MRFTYDDEVDILMVYLSDAAITRSERLGNGPVIDYAEDGSIVSMEFLDASKHYPMDELKKHPAIYGEPIPLADAAVTAGCTAKALQLAINRGRLKGQKIGRNWTTTDAALAEYLESRKHEGPGSAGEPAVKANAFTIPTVGGKKAVSTTKT